MKVEISINEVMDMIKAIQTKPEQIFEMIRVDIRKNAGAYISELMETELTRFLGRERYEYGQGEVNRRNGSCHRNLHLKRHRPSQCPGSKRSTRRIQDRGNPPE